MFAFWIPQRINVQKASKPHHFALSFPAITQLLLWPWKGQCWIWVISSIIETIFIIIYAFRFVLFWRFGEHSSWPIWKVGPAHDNRSVEHMGESVDLWGCSFHFMFQENAVQNFYSNGQMPQNNFEAFPGFSNNWAAPRSCVDSRPRKEIDSVRDYGAYRSLPKMLNKNTGDNYPIHPFPFYQIIQHLLIYFLQYFCEFVIETFDYKKC